ncbi:sigma-70 family RNA polymerase sigma factor [Verrucomicrobium spinosum]|uniref:sigma-70 family RNA polymerase sigma factor n=1 Tax=Verrucomicrobium spinosum TaxID=2736 RepID=UPI0001744E47|nr:sigma-70 family RNA polymerase sigma factor [Verrucomicrobium spinosum]
MPLIPVETLQRAQAGELKAQAAFVQFYQREVRAFVSMLTADLASVDDLAQETFLRALDRLDRIQQPESTGAFLRGIARNVALEHARRYRRQSERAQKFVRLMEDLAPGEDTQDDWWSDDTELTGALKTCMGTLPEKSRSILDWRYREECDATEIAARLGTTSTAIRATLKRVRVSLWQCIRGRYEMAGVRG